MKQDPRIASSSSGNTRILGGEQKLATQNRQEEAQGKGKGQVPQTMTGSFIDVDIILGEVAVQNLQEETQEG